MYSGDFSITLRICVYIMSSFFELLKWRKVYRVVAAYIVTAGFLIQILTPSFELEQRRVRARDFQFPVGRSVP
jgi:hypothetical protein